MRRTLVTLAILAAIAPASTVAGVLPLTVTAATSSSPVVDIQSVGRYQLRISYSGFGPGTHTATEFVNNRYVSRTWTGDSAVDYFSPQCRGSVCSYGRVSVWGTCSGGSSYGPLYSPGGTVCTVPVAAAQQTGRA